MNNEPTISAPPILNVEDPALVPVQSDPETSAPVPPAKPLAVLLGKHHDITPFASSDGSRYVLNSVHYYREKSVLEATDGRVLIRVPMSSEQEPGEFPARAAHDTAPMDCIIPLAPFKKAIANIPNGGTLPALKQARLDAAPVKFKGADRVECVITSTDLETEQAVRALTIEGAYPNTDKVIPTEEPKFSVTLAPEILLRLATYAQKHGREDYKGIRFDFTDEMAPVRFKFRLEAGTEASGVLMPMRSS